jgi:hypothetical protein
MRASWGLHESAAVTTDCQRVERPYLLVAEHLHRIAENPAAHRLLLVTYAWTKGVPSGHFQRCAPAVMCSEVARLGPLCYEIRTFRSFVRFTQRCS